MANESAGGFGCGALIIFVVVLSYITAGIKSCVNPNGNSSSSSSSDSDYEAIAQVKLAVERRCKSPGSVSFPIMTAPSVSHNGSITTVSGQFTAKNSFGVELTNSYVGQYDSVRKTVSVTIIE